MSQQHGETLRNVTTGTRVHFEWLRFRSAIKGEHLDNFADSVGADAGRLSASKALVNTKDEAIKAVNQIRRQARQWWWCNTLPYVEPGIRLLRTDRIDEFTRTMNDYRSQLATAVGTLVNEFDRLKRAAESELGDLYRESDYPSTPRDEFQISWDFPSLTPPSYLQELNPDLYAAEVEKMQARFETAVQIAEDEFAEKFASLVTDLSQRIDSDKSRFPSRKLKEVTEYIEQFRSLSIGSNSQLDDLVDQFETVAKGVDKDTLGDLKEQVSGNLQSLGEQFGAMLEARPTRRIRRRNRRDDDPITPADDTAADSSPATSVTTGA